MALFGDPTVRDTLSCLSLLVFGAGASAAAAAEATSLASGGAPPTAAAAAMSAVAFLPLAGSVATSVAGNLATNVVQRLNRITAGRLLSSWKGIDENHVVVQALRRAHLDALRAVLKTFREVIATDPNQAALEGFATTAANFSRTEWKTAERLAFRGRDGLTPAEDDIRRAVLDALPVNFGTALAHRRASVLDTGPQAAFGSLRDALVEGALVELRSRTLPGGETLPPTFVALFRGEGVPDSWFDLFVRAAADRLKGEDAFAAIWNAEQDAHTQALLVEVAERVARIDRLVEAPTRRGDASAAQFREAIRGRPTNLLVARYRIVPYLDRGDVLKGALDWALRGASSAARGRLYVAPGGYGKTRFAIELVLALVDRGWACSFLSDRNVGSPGALAGMVAGAGETVAGRLVVLDYAESQIARLKEVAAAAKEGAGAPFPVRVVALARSPEGWWEGTQIDADVAAVFEPAPLELLEAPLEAGERQTLFSAGMSAFRAALAEAGLAHVGLAGSTVPEGDLLDRPLTVAMAAFLAARGVGSNFGDSVFARIFAEERRHWQRVLHVETDNDPVLTSLHRAAAQITLVQGATFEGGAALIGADSRAVAHGLPSQERTIAALQTIYGDNVGDTAFLRAVEPDLLGEHAVIAALQTDHHHLLDTTLAAAAKGAPLSDSDIASILTVMVRASRPEHDGATRAMARASLDALGSSIATFDARIVRRIEAALPPFSLPLTTLSVAVAQRVEETSESDDERARAFNNLAVRLSETGQRLEALEPARRAVEIGEDLARDNPAAYRPDLAMSLNTYAVRLSETGQRSRALEPARRAVEIYEELARDNPAAYRLHFAMSLNNYACHLSAAGQRSEALEPAHRAADICEALARDDPAAYRPDLASSLGNYANCLGETGQRSEAVEPARRAVEIREALARDNYAAYLPDLAKSLHNYANHLGEAGQRREALEPARRAVDIREALARDNPAAYRPALASSLSAFAIRLSQTGQRDEALEPARRAVEIYEALARDNPAAYRPDLAMSLNTYANRLGETGQQREVLEPARRAVEIYEALAFDNPAAYRPDLASSLNNYANRLSETGQRSEALHPARRAVEIGAALARDNPAAYRPTLAMSLGTLGHISRSVGDSETAVDAYSDALHAFCQCLPSDPNRFGLYLSLTAERLTATLFDLGRTGEIEPKLRSSMGDVLYTAWHNAQSDRSKPVPPEAPPEP